MRIVRCSYLWVVTKRGRRKLPIGTDNAVTIKSIKTELELIYFLFRHVSLYEIKINFNMLLDIIVFYFCFQMKMKGHGKRISPPMDFLYFMLIWMICVSEILACPALCRCNMDYYMYCDNASITDSQLPSILAEIPTTATYIDFSYNQIQNLKNIDLFTRFKQLKNLNFADNKLRTIEHGAFKSLSDVLILNLENNNLENISRDTFSAQRKLKQLYLQNNNIGSIHEDAFKNLTSLKELHLQGNNLVSLPLTVFRHIPTLQILDLSENNLLMLPDNLFSSLSSVQKLFLQNNEIVNLSQKAFQGLSKIKILNLHGNKISHIEKVHLDGVRSSLQNLDLSNNLIGEINNDLFKGMSNLKILDLTNNQIYVIENFAFELLSLDKLSLKGNNLTHIWRTYFSGVKRIISLDVSHNQITDITSGAFQSFRESIYVLKLNNNKINHVHAGMFQGMTSLQVLDLAKNLINQIDNNGFSDLKSLTELNLHKNKLQSIQGDIIQGLTLLRKLFLDCNPMKIVTGFNMMQPIHITLNLTMLSVMENNVNFSWPLKDGKQIYWAVSVKCVDKNTKCTVNSKPDYLPPFRKHVNLDQLPSNSRFYICANPIFVNSDVNVEQCLFVNTLEKSTTTTLKPITTQAQTATGNTQTLHKLCVFFVLFLVVLLFSH